MNKNPVNGMRDILPREMKIRAHVLNVIRNTYRKYGFSELETPVVESIENLSGKQGGENEKLIFKIMKRGEKLQIETGKTENDLADSGLRYDLTMPLSRYYASHNTELTKPFKALQIGPVFRAERPQKGRFREFYQCDIDILGDGTNLAEKELILATGEALTNVGFKNFVIRINDRKLLKQMAEYAGLSEDSFENIFIALDKMDKIGKEGVLKELIELGLAEDAVNKYIVLIESLSGQTREEAFELLTKTLTSEDAKEILENLSDIFDTVESAKGESFTLEFDPTLVRGMGYYTGPIFEIASKEFSSSIGGGGRYDKMIGSFVGQDTPAAGFSIGFERIISILCDSGFQVPGENKKISFLLEKGLSREKESQALKEAKALREQGTEVRVDRMIKNKKFQKEQLTLEGFNEFKEFYEKEWN